MDVLECWRLWWKEKTVKGDFRIGPWLVEPQLNSISDRSRQQDRRVEPRVMQVLVYLAEHAGEVVPKEGLIRAVWPDVFVTDDALVRCISELRRALEDDAREPRFIQTIVKGGYRLIAEVKPVEETEAPNRNAPARAIPRRRLALAAGLAVLALLSAAGYLGWRWFRSPPAPSRGRVMLMVLPFQSLSGDPEQEYFSDGLTEELIAQLAGMQPGRLGVIALTTVMHYKKAGKTIDQIGRELGIDYVIEGSVRREQNRVRIAAQLIQVTDQAHLWAQSYDRELSGILAVQTEIARSIAAQIRLTLGSSEAQQLARPRPVDPEAYVAYLKGAHHLHKVSPEGYRLAADNFQQAVKLDPTYARSWLGLGNAYRFRGTWWGDMRPRQAASRAKEALARALQLDPQLGDAYAALGWTKFAFDWDWAGAEADFRRGIELAPSSGGAHSAYGNFLRCLGRLDEARVHMDRSLEIDPLDPLDLADSAALYMALNQPERAEKLALRALEIDPDLAYGKLRLALVWANTDRLDKAIQFLEKGTARPQPDVLSLAVLGHLYSHSGREAQARTALQRITPMPAAGPAMRGELHLCLGEKRQAMELFRQALEEHDPHMVWVRGSDSQHPLSNEPEYQEIFRRMNFPQ